MLTGLCWIETKLSIRELTASILVNDVTNLQLTGNYTNDIAGTAITVGHSQHVYLGDYTTTNHEIFPANIEGICKNVTITNNFIYDSGVLFNRYPAVTAFFVDSLAFQHNRIQKTPYVGISLGWGWSNFNGNSVSVSPGNPTKTAKNNNVSYNQFIDTLQILDDGGPIYMLGSQPTTTITNNYIQGVPGGLRYGLHPDEGSAYITMQNNVLNVDSGIRWTLNSDNWDWFGYKHDLNFTQNYATVNKISNKDLPNRIMRSPDISGRPLFYKVVR